LKDELRKLVIDDTEYTTEVPEKKIGPAYGLKDPLEARAFIPGNIIEVRVSPGDRVRRGDVLLLLEAMKMYNEIVAEADGTVEEVAVSVGDRVTKNQLLVKLSR